MHKRTTWDKPVVLLMEDDHEARKMYKLHFELAGYPVDIASTLAGAKKTIDSMKEPCIAILDWQMGSGDASAIISHISETAEYRLLAYVFTGKPTRGLKDRAMAAGAHRFFVKTVDSLDHIQRCLEADFKLMRGNVLDPKTKLFNAMWFRQTVVSELMTMRDRPHMNLPSVCSMLYVDIDRFKSINDDHGHDMGDRAIIAVANVLRKSTRRVDHLCRLHGDEFAIWLVDIDEKGAINKALEFQEEVANISLISPLGRALTLSVSAGAAELRREDVVDDAEEAYDKILRKADERMRRAKDARGGTQR
jgi:diguanylate cyclase (GGDEF)-like protein